MWKVNLGTLNVKAIAGSTENGQASTSVQVAGIDGELEKNQGVIIVYGESRGDYVQAYGIDSNFGGSTKPSDQRKLDLAQTVYRYTVSI